ncbi:uncharacterized protein F5Z01DRAFT_685399 [Emericellopsis atlantica]|uniref:Uncharacterized protein n=1 Tax=Emericellopsis atlantica TaxID=2614577 RepID=A0A9P7ZVR3_9HYPO|nr:uncharacterized protein F5Z01DRAFT_685399 [Emericellopsis atlantica]KAG9259264.1 hypothetical protein F5Z01DRAFT_685399 [Emericellopsis atlantica]
MSDHGWCPVPAMVEYQCWPHAAAFLQSKGFALHPKYTGVISLPGDSIRCKSPAERACLHVDSAGGLSQFSDHHPNLSPTLHHTGQYWSFHQKMSIQPWPAAIESENVATNILKNTFQLGGYPIPAFVGWREQTLWKKLKTTRNTLSNSERATLYTVWLWQQPAYGRECSSPQSSAEKYCLYLEKCGCTWEKIERIWTECRDAADEGTSTSQKGRVMKFMEDIAYGIRSHYDKKPSMPARNTKEKKGTAKQVSGTVKKENTAPSANPNLEPLGKPKPKISLEPLTETTNSQTVAFSGQASPAGQVAVTAAAGLSRTERIKSKLLAVVASMPRKNVSSTPTQIAKLPFDLGSSDVPEALAEISKKPPAIRVNWIEQTEGRLTAPSTTSHDVGPVNNLCQCNGSRMASGHVASCPEGQPRDPVQGTEAFTATWGEGHVTHGPLSIELDDHGSMDKGFYTERVPNSAQCARQKLSCLKEAAGQWGNDSSRADDAFSTYHGEPRSGAGRPAGLPLEQPDAWTARPATKAAVVA